MLKLFTLPSTSTSQAPKYQTSQRSVKEKTRQSHILNWTGAPIHQIRYAPLDPFHSYRDYEFPGCVQEIHICNANNGLPHRTSRFFLLSDLNRNAQTEMTNSNTSSSHNGIEDSSLQGCYSVSTGIQLSALRRSLLFHLQDLATHIEWAAKS
jgi:hypothetical protein